MFFEVEKVIFNNDIICYDFLLKDKEWDFINYENK